MTTAISNTSPLLYLYRVGAISLLADLFDELLDDMLARRTAQAAGLSVWGTLRVLLEAKSHHLITAVGPFIVRLQDAGMWISPDLMRRILTLADEIE